MISNLLYRLGTLLVVGDILYLVIWTAARGGADGHLFRTVLAAAGVCLGGGLVASLAGKARTGITAPSCPTCGRKVSRGRVYCEDHLAETINRYRDQERNKGK
jgi:hypothetical protein